MANTLSSLRTSPSSFSTKSKPFILTNQPSSVLPGGGTPLHYHNTYEEHLTPVKGTLGIVLGTETKMFKEGETAVVPKGTLHRFFNDSEEEVVVCPFPCPAPFPFLLGDRKEHFASSLHELRVGMLKILILSTAVFRQSNPCA